MQKLPNEKWKEITIEHPLKLRYAISNKGRMVSFADKIQNGNILKGSKTDGYSIFRFKVTVRKKTVNRHYFIHKLVGEYFLKKNSDDKTFVLHLDHKRGNNDVKNLKWATKEQMIEHNKKSPKVIKAKKQLIEFNKNRPGHKLTKAKVLLIKKRILNPNRKTTLKEIAQQYDISEMQLYRIKSGENWGHVKV